MSHKNISVISFVFLLLLLWMVPAEFQYLRGRSVLLKAILVALSLVAIVGGSIFFFLFTEKTHRRYPRHPLPGPIKNLAKNVFDIIFIFAGTIISNFLSPIYMLITNLLLIFVVTLTVLLTQTTEFGLLLDLFVNIIQIFVQYYLDRNDLVPMILSSAICGGLVCLRNNPREATSTDIENPAAPVGNFNELINPVTSAGESLAAESQDIATAREIGLITGSENSAQDAELRNAEILHELSPVIIPLTPVGNSGAASESRNPTSIIEDVRLTTVVTDSVGADSQDVVDAVGEDMPR